EKVAVHKNIRSEYGFEFEGTGIVLRGDARKRSNALPDYVFELALLIDGEKVDEFRMSTNFRTRRHDIFWRYQLPKGRHKIMVVITNPKDGYHLRAPDYIVYTDAPINGHLQHAVADS